MNTEQLQSGDYEAWEGLFARWYGPLCGYACSMVRDMDEAEDVVQKTFCKLWDVRATMVIRTSVKSYLYRMVHNACLNRMEQQRVRAAHLQRYGHGVPAAVENAASRVLHGELQERVHRAVAALPPQCRRVFELSRFRQLSYAEIAAELEVSTSTVENHMAKALKLLRVALKEFLSVILLFTT